MILFFDTETTGLPKNWKAPITDFENWPRLVQLAYQLFDDQGNKLIEGDYLVKPSGFTIPMAATEIHRITNEKANSQGLNITNVLKEFKILLDDAETIVAHNIDYDEKILGCEFLRLNLSNPFIGKSKICTMESSTNYCAITGPYGYKWPKLSELYYKLFNSNFEEAHNAMIDIQATSKCFWELVKRSVIKINSSKSINYSKIEINSLTVKNFKPASIPFAELIGFEDESTIKNAGLKQNSKQLIPYRNKDKWGFCTPNKEIVIDCEFDLVNRFTEGFAAIKIKGRWGYIDACGNVIIEPKYDDVKAFKEGVTAVFVKGQGWNFIDVKGTSIFCYFDYISDFSEGLAPVGIGNKYGFVDKQGVFVIPSIYNRIYNSLKHEPDTDFLKVSEGLICIRNNNYKYGFFDRNGEMIIPFIYDVADNFSNGLAQVGINFTNNGNYAKSGFIDTTGSIVIPMKYNWIKARASHFVEGLELVNKGFEHESERTTERFYINRKGEIIITQPDSLLFLEDFSNGLAKVKNENWKYGFINRLGENVIECIFDEVQEFSDGLSRIRLNGKYGFINTLGKIVFDFKYFDIKDVKFRTGLFHISHFKYLNAPLWEGYIDKNGVEFWED